MIKVVWDSGFKKSYKKKIKNNAELKAKFFKSIELFSINPYTPQLRTHKLSGKLKKIWSFTVTPDCRVIFNFINNNEVLLIDIGSHDELY